MTIKKIIDGLYFAVGTIDELYKMVIPMKRQIYLENGKLYKEYING